MAPPAAFHDPVARFVRNLALRNDLTQREWNFAAQRTIDRIIFLRIAEDRGIKEYGRLQALLNGGHVYELYRLSAEEVAVVEGER